LGFSIGKIRPWRGREGGEWWFARSEKRLVSMTGVGGETEGNWDGEGGETPLVTQKISGLDSFKCPNVFLAGAHVQREGEGPRQGVDHEIPC